MSFWESRVGNEIGGMMKKRRENFFRSFGVSQYLRRSLTPTIYWTAPAQIESIRAARNNLPKGFPIIPKIMNYSFLLFLARPLILSAKTV